MLKSPLYCDECKKIIDDLEEMLFVQGGVPKGFCSEECIEKYFLPLVNEFECNDLYLRKELNLVKEPALKVLDNLKKVEKLMEFPDEVWQVQNDLGSKLHCLIKRFEDEELGHYTFICVCFLYETKPSFIFFISATQNIEYLKSYQQGIKLTFEDGGLTEQEGHTQIQLDEESIKDLESKKSAIIALLIEQGDESDIPLESYVEYDQFIDPTMQSPDEIYCVKDNDGDKLFRYVKAFEKNGETFYYFVCCLIYDDNWSENTEALLPVFSFPTKSKKVYKYFAKGEIISGKLKN